MQTLILILALVALAGFGFVMGKARSAVVSNGSITTLHSLPGHYGFYVALWCGTPSLVLLAIWLVCQAIYVDAAVMSGLPVAVTQGLDEQQLRLVLQDIVNTATGNVVSANVSPEIEAAAERYNSLHKNGFSMMVVATILVGGLGLFLSRSRITQEMRARNSVEKIVGFFLFLSSLLAILTTVGIVFSLIFESLRFFAEVNIFDFLFGLSWSPQTAIRADQVGASGAFGAVPLIMGTVLITIIAMFVAAPIGLMAAIYMAEYADKRFRSVAKPMLEVLAGIPTVVYGFFAALTVAPFFRNAGESIGLSVSSESALAAGVVMGIMIIPFVSSLSDDVINAVPQSLRDGSFGLGATKSETIKSVVIPAALPGIVGALLLAVSRAIGETMIVVMAAGLAANLTINPLEAVTTVTVQIVTLLVGDQEFDSAKTLSAFALGLMLFTVTLALNVVALAVVRKYREKYD